jgi:hypothetical protein
MKKNATRSKVRRGKVRRVIKTPSLLAILDVPVIYAPEMPKEPLLEAKTVKFLAEARKRACSGDKLLAQKARSRIIRRFAGGVS